MTKSTVGLHEAVLARMAAKFAGPVIQNSLRSLYVEEQVGVLLGDGWVPMGADWAGWDFETSSAVGVDPVRLEVKQSAARQTWDQSGNPSRGSFDIATRTGYFKGNIWFPSTARLAEIYVFAWHGRFDASCDQTDPSQWTYFVIPTSGLPMQKSIAQSRIKLLATESSASELRDVVDGLVDDIRGET